MRQVHSPTVRLRRLAAEMRRARLAKGYERIEDAAKELGWSAPKLSRIEGGETRYIKPADLDKLLDMYEITDEAARQSLYALAREARQSGWWSQYKDVFAGNALPDFEVEASMIRTYEGQVIPGLLQTEDYADAVFQGGQAHAAEVVERHVLARMERQQILNRQKPPQLSAVIDEGALRRRVRTPGVMADQLQHLVNMATRHNIDIQVLPFDAGPHAATTGSFVIMDFPGNLDPSIVFTETATSRLFVEDEDAVGRYVTMFGQVQTAALRPADSIEYIRQLMSAESDQS